MSNLQITFERLWPLLILIPSFAVALIPYFRLSKKYRRTRNRIISLVLHLIITLMAVFLLSGMKIEYKVANENNEIILLVDVSDTEEQVAETRDEFVNTVLSQSRFDNYKVGVVTFGFDQKYAVPLTYDVKSIYPAYSAADTPDRSATNIEDALVYTASLFDNPESAKIVLITDGFETDGKAMSVIRSIRSSGVNVDVAEIPSSFGGDDVRIVGVRCAARVFDNDVTAHIDRCTGRRRSDVQLQNVTVVTAIALRRTLPDAVAAKRGRTVRR